mmetsp:Transcript_27846/g.61446  ORF Transcript_27846/g.61446 Transcript_27846/m.61446 type:complete len:100 (+) Transcript_27846:773-1072(+)
MENRKPSETPRLAYRLVAVFVLRSGGAPRDDKILVDGKREGRWDPGQIVDRLLPERSSRWIHRDLRNQKSRSFFSNKYESALSCSLNGYGACYRRRDTL